ncbi:MAG: MATE family efflux transporter [Dorea formicigenerans]
MRTAFLRRELLPMTKIALPSILQQSTVSIGHDAGAVCSEQFWSRSTGWFSAGMRIESICIVPMVAIGNAISSYTAQNIGAGQQKRCREAVCAGK